MRSSVLAFAFSFALAASLGCDSGTPKLTPSEVHRLEAMWVEHQVLLITAACSVEPAFADACADILGSAWQADDPAYLTTRVAPDTLSQGFATLRDVLAQMPDSTRWSSMDRMGAWLCAYRSLQAVETCVGPEDFATAVAFTGSVGDLFPRDEKLRQVMGHDVGSSLAAAEHTGLMYQVATRISSLAPAERSKPVQEIATEALQVTFQRTAER
jgi:hypothetical protein